MFILEESQLLEDTISNPTVLKLYKTLCQHEISSDRIKIIDEILTDEKCQSLSKFISEFSQSYGNPLNEPLKDCDRLNPDQKSELCQKLKLEPSDVVALTLILSGTLTHLFVIDNFVGPNNAEILERSYQNLPTIFQDLRRTIDFSSLSIDGSEVYHLIINPWLLRLTQSLWNLLKSLECSRPLLEPEFLVWKHRFLTIFLMVLYEPSELLMDELRKIQEYMFDHHILKTKENNFQLAKFNTIELCCELAQSALLRNGLTSCRKFFEYALELSGVSIEHTGVLGKRTKFQQNDLSQLVVKVTKMGTQNETSIENLPDLPMEVKLDDDTLLPDISFVSSDNNDIIGKGIGTEAQLLMLIKLDIMLKSEVMEESLKDEWTQAYLRSIIKSSTLWAVSYKSLAMRSMVERKHMRRMDRALLQMEELIKACETNNDIRSERMRAFYSILPSSKWQVKRSLGDISFDLGLYKNALDIYLTIEYWEGIIKCYSVLDQTIKAEKIIRQELQKQETPYLYCLLGDATGDIQEYEKSWLLSNGKFARAKKSIGTYYYTRKQYQEAINNYELALKVNPSNTSILSLLAYCYLITEQYEKAAEHYRNLTYHDDSSFLAWNNLSKAYIKLNQKERAWRTLREAIKCNYEAWKIWENFMTVSIEIGALDDVITAWHRLIDIKSSHKDDQVLRSLTQALISRSPNQADSDYMKLLCEALKLIARIISTSDCSPRLWVCYYKLLIKEFELMQLKSGSLSKFDKDSRISKITNALQRATPIVLASDAEWLKELDKIDIILNNFDELIDCYHFAFEVAGPRPEIWRQWKYFKMNIGNVMKILEKKGFKNH